MPVSPALKTEPAPTAMQESLNAEKMFADFQRDGSDIGSVSFDMAAAWLQVLALNSSNPAAWTWPVTLSLVDMPAAGAHTYTIHLHVTCSVGTHDQVIDGTNTMLKVRGIKK